MFLCFAYVRAWTLTGSNVLKIGVLNPPRMQIHDTWAMSVIPSWAGMAGEQSVLARDSVWKANSHKQTPTDAQSHWRLVIVNEVVFILIVWQAMQRVCCESSKILLALNTITDIRPGCLFVYLFHHPSIPDPTLTQPRVSLPLFSILPYHEDTPRLSDKQIRTNCSFVGWCNSTATTT